MNATLPYPILFQPVYKDYIWGGTRIAETYGRQNTPTVCAESWEIADRPEGMSIVSNGPLAGVSLQDLVRDWGRKLVGSRYAGGPFPLLIKIIDASKRLSLQVHPNDKTAAEFGGEAKTECWYVLGSDEQGFMYAGFNRGTGSEEFRRLLEQQDAESILHAIPARRRSTVFIPGGRVHAIGEGCLLLEVQQNSNTTYRVYDWGRVGHDGKPRELHVEQAMRVILWDDIRPSAQDPRHLAASEPGPAWELVTSDYFRLERHDLTQPRTLKPDPASFTILFIEEGTVEVTCGGIREHLHAGTSCLIPACAVSYALHPGEGAPASIVTIQM